jgi:hypothetical protein
MGRIAAAGAMRLNAGCGSLGDEATKPCPWATFGPPHTPWQKRTMVRVPQLAKSGACAGFRGSTLPSAPARWNQSADAGPTRNAGTKCCACAVFAEKSPAKKTAGPIRCSRGENIRPEIGSPQKNRRRAIDWGIKLLEMSDSLEARGGLPRDPFQIERVDGVRGVRAAGAAGGGRPSPATTARRSRRSA